MCLAPSLPPRASSFPSLIEACPRIPLPSFPHTTIPYLRLPPFRQSKVLDGEPRKMHQLQRLQRPD